jgi:hypothetical protein
MARSAASARASAAAEWEQVAAQVASLAASPVSAAVLSAQEPAEYSVGLASQASFLASLAPDAYPASLVWFQA